MKSFITIVFTLFIINTHSQNYKLIDEKVKKYPSFSQIDNLAIYVNNSFDTDEEKVRAFYTWIACNITYDMKKYYSVRPPVLNVIFNSKYYNISIENQKRTKLAKQVFKDRKALCLGFSSLFTELCIKSNIEVKTIKGITKSSVENIDNPHYTKNHSWNAVKIDDQWKLLDITFSSGYLNTKTGKWTKQFNDFYFFINPKKLLFSHLPAKPKFQLISEPINTKAFFKQPIFYKKYFESGLQLYNYQKGLLSVSKEDKKIRLNFKYKKQNRAIYYKYDNENVLKKLSLKKTNIDNYTATIKHKSNKSKVLSLYYENQRILDFKIKQ